MGEKLKDRIKELRIKNKLTQAELAEKVYVTDKAVSKWETGNSYPDYEALEALSNLFNVTTDFLLKGNNKNQGKELMSPNKALETYEEKISRWARCIESCLHCDIVNIEELSAYNDLELVQYTFKNYAISIKELLHKMFNDKDYGKLFKYSIDHRLNDIAYSLLRLKVDGINPLLSSIEKTIPMLYKEGRLDFNKEYFMIDKYSDNRKTEEEVKNQIIEELSLKYDKEKFLEGLTREYFEKLLSEDNIEMLAIKLCKRLEIILLCDYHLEGSLEEKMSFYTSRYENDDDIVTLLHNLRKYRNGIGHPSNTDITLSETDFQNLINYICELG